MGYEVKLIIGEFMEPRPEYAREKTLRRDGDELWYPYKKDKDDKFIPSGRMESTMIEAGRLDLCKCATGAFGKLVSDNEEAANKADQNIVWKWWRDGNHEDETDCYGARKIPVPLEDVIKAIEADVKAGEKYHRFKWTLTLLKSMKKHSGGWKLKVILYGH